MSACEMTVVLVTNVLVTNVLVTNVLVTNVLVTNVLPKVFNPANVHLYDPNKQMEMNEVDEIVSYYHPCKKCRKIYNWIYCIYMNETGTCQHPEYDLYPDCSDCHSVTTNGMKTTLYEQQIDWSETTLHTQVSEIAQLLWLPLNKILHAPLNKELYLDEFDINICFQLVQLQLDAYQIYIVRYKGRVWLMVHNLLCLLIEFDLDHTVGNILATLQYDGEKILTVDSNHFDLPLSSAFVNPVCVPITIERV